MKFTLPKQLSCMVPEKSGACAKYAQSEMIRLLAKLGTNVKIAGKNKGLLFTLGDAGKIPAQSLKKIRNNGFVSCVTKTGIALAAKTEKGLLNAVYTLIEDLGITFVMPGEKNEIPASDAPFALDCGVFVRNMRSEHAGISCEFAAVTEEEYRGEEWMAYFAKLRFDIVFRHAGGHIRNDPKYGFTYGDGAHEFHHLLPKEFKEAHPETSRQIQPDDFGGSDPLAGVRFQRRWEQAAFRLGGGDYRAPAQRVGDFLQGVRSAGCGDVEPTYRPGVTYTGLDECLPGFVTETMRLALQKMDRQLSGFAAPGALLTGVETRSSSPLRILRGPDGQASLAGLYPCGEGAGYAGGILSAAVDGMRQAEALLAARSAAAD